MELIKLRDIYRDGWGDKCADSKLIVELLYLKITDLNGRIVTLPLALFKENYPLIICIDLKAHSDTCNLEIPIRINFKR